MLNFAAIFDMDGVIVPNHRYHLRSWQRMLRRHGVDMTVQEFNDRYFGRVSQESLRLIFGRKINQKVLKQYALEKEQIYRQIYSRAVRPTPGLAKFLGALRAAGVKIALATSGPKENIRFVFQKTGLRNFFGVVLDSSMVSRGKPHPEVYLKAAKKLGADPRRCVVFEDSLPGVESARRAGMRVVGLATTLAARELSGADLVVKDFRRLDPEKINRLLLRRGK